MTSTNTKPLPFGSEDLQLPAELRGQLRDHIQDLRTRFLARGWGKRVGFGERPALVVIDLARYWGDPTIHIGANVDSIIEATCRVLPTVFASLSPKKLSANDVNCCAPSPSGTSL